MDDLVYHYLRLLDQLGIEQAVVVGASLGGWIAAELAVHSPHRVARLVLLSPAGLRMPEAPPADLFIVPPERIVATLFHDPAAAEGLFPAEPSVDDIMRIYRNNTAFARYAWRPFLNDPKLERRLYRITSPDARRSGPTTTRSSRARTRSGTSSASRTRASRSSRTAATRSTARSPRRSPTARARLRERRVPVKFNFFHLMPYPTLPEDFDERFATPSLTYPNGQFDPQVGVEVYNRYLDELEYADELGYDGICVNEHHQSAYGMMPAPNIMAAALARRTKNAKVMVLGNAIGLHQYPLRVAEEIAMLDHLSRVASSRASCAGSAGSTSTTGSARCDSRERFNEAHDLIIKAWTSTEPFEWWGKHYEFRYVNVWPRPLQDPHPDIYIPGAGSRGDHEVLRGEALHVHERVRPDARREGVVRRLPRGGRRARLRARPGEDRLRDPDLRRRDPRAGAPRGQGLRGVPLPQGAKQGLEIVLPPGYMSESSLRGMLSAGPRKSFGQMSYEDLVDAGMVIVGSPESVNEQVQRLQGELGFGQIMALMCIGDTPHERVVRTMELFAREVAPNFSSAPVPAAAA